MMWRVRQEYGNGKNGGSTKGDWLSTMSPEQRNGEEQ